MLLRIPPSVSAAGGKGYQVKIPPQLSGVSVEHSKSLMIMGIMVAVFSNMFRFDIVNYPVYLIIGQTIFNFVSDATNQAMWSITGNAALLKKTYVPNIFLPCQR